MQWLNDVSIKASKIYRKTEYNLSFVDHLLPFVYWKGHTGKKGITLFLHNSHLFKWDFAQEFLDWPNEEREGQRLNVRDRTFWIPKSDCLKSLQCYSNQTLWGLIVYGLQ